MEWIACFGSLVFEQIATIVRIAITNHMIIFYPHSNYLTYNFHALT
jgi:hypothetical protein